jgi:hypothetical protein
MSAVPPRGMGGVMHETAPGEGMEGGGNRMKEDVS